MIKYFLKYDKYFKTTKLVGYARLSPKDKKKEKNCGMQ